MTFDRDNLEPGLILAYRNTAPDAVYGPAIRATLGSYTNHNGMIVYHNTRGWLIGEAIQPRSCYTELEEYEKLVTAGHGVVRIWRVRGATDNERISVCRYWQAHLDGLKYANYSIAKLAIFRFVNNLPWKMRIHGVWCTELVVKAWRSTGRDPFLKPDGTRKNNPTPRTLENRLVSGALKDVTATVLKDIE